MEKIKWTWNNCEAGRYIGIMEFLDEMGEYHNFEIIELKDKILFGGFTNSGFLESGYIIKDDILSLDENLSELLSDLEIYYNQGGDYTNNIIYNDRM